MELWKRVLLKLPKVGIAYRAYRWFRFTRKNQVIKRARSLRKFRKQLKKELKQMEGKKTYTGIAIVALGFIMSWLGIGGEAEATELVTNGMQLIGLVLATYGRYKAKPK